VEDGTLLWARPTIDEIPIERKRLVDGTGRAPDGVC